MENSDKQEIKVIIEEVLDEQTIISDERLRQAARDVLNDSQWYSNQDLFEKFTGEINRLEPVINALRAEMEQFEKKVEKHNQVIPRVTQMEQQLAGIVSEEEGKKGQKESMRENVNLWISAILLLATLSNITFGVMVFFIKG